MSVSPAEMKAALSSLFDADPSRSCYLPAADFQASLERAGLAFGTPPVDHILSLCDVKEGVVDYSRFAEEIDRTPVGPVRASQRGHEFESAMGGAGGPGAVAPSHRQDAEVQALKKHLTALYNEFDHGKVGVDMFRQRIRDMGLHETDDLQRLLRQPHGFSLRQMMTALSAPVGFGVAGSAAGREKGHADAQDILATSGGGSRPDKYVASLKFPWALRQRYGLCPPPSGRCLV